MCVPQAGLQASRIQSMQQRFQWRVVALGRTVDPKNRLLPSPADTDSRHWFDSACKHDFTSTRTHDIHHLSSPQISNLHSQGIMFICVPDLRAVKHRKRRSDEPSFHTPPRVLKFVTRTTAKIHSGFEKRMKSIEKRYHVRSLWISLYPGSNRAFTTNTDA